MMARRRSRHGLGRLKVRVNASGWSAIDRRSAAAQELLRWRSELLRDLGGEASLSAQKLGLVELTCRTRLFLDHVDAYLLGLSSLINKRRKTMVPILRERQVLCDSLSRLLGQLGLERVPRPMPSLNEYISAKQDIGSKEAAQQ
jgi:hypothetical protein